MEAIYIEYASKGVAGAGLGLGIAGTALGLLGNNVIPNILGGNNVGCSENAMVNRYELNMQNQITNKDMEIAYLRGRDASKSDSLELYKYIDGKLEGINAAISQQAVYNATCNATINCMQGQIAQLYSLTKISIPNTSICPGWGNVTVTPATTTGG